MAYYQGRFAPKNCNKYKGDPTNIIARSGWEYKVFQWLDENPQVLEWASEEVVIPYVCVTDKQFHRYFPDIYVKFQNGDRYIVEIKPYDQTQEPKPRRATKSYIDEVFAYGKNFSKWSAAKKFAEMNGYKFQIWTENELQKLGIKV